MAESIIAQVSAALQDALLSTWNSFLGVIPNLLVAVIVTVIGWVIGKVVKQIVVKILQSTKIDQWVEEQNLSPAIGGQDVSALVGSFVKWYIIAVFLAQALSLINLQVLKDFVQLFVTYIPLALGALAIMIIGLLIGRYARNVIEATQHKFKKTIAIALELVIIYIAAVMALQTIGFNVTILVYAFLIALAAFVISVAIIVGVAFGMAFRDDAKAIAEDMKKSMKK